MDHHAYLLLGERGEVETFLESIFKDVGIKRVGNPDVFTFEQSVFAVDDAREISERAIEKAFGEKKVFLIHAEKFTPEAQNALLKTLEEPTSNTHFFISAREPQIFLPTLLSRLHKVVVGGELDKSKEVEKFLTNPIAKRLTFAKKFADEVKGDLPAGSGGRERGAGALAEFLDQLLLKLRQDGAPLDTQKKIMTLRTFARDSSAQPRIIIEHLALVLPQT